MTRMMIAVVTAFTLCWLPLNALIVAGDQDSGIWQYEHIVYVWFACHWLAMSHAAHNPLIYCWMSDRFREGFCRICRRVTCEHHRRTTQGGTTRCRTYTAYSASDKRWHDSTPSPSTKVAMQHVCRYDGCVVEEDIVSDSAV